MIYSPTFCHYIWKSEELVCVFEVNLWHFALLIYCLGLLQLKYTVREMLIRLMVLVHLMARDLRMQQNKSSITDIQGLI